MTDFSRYLARAAAFDKNLMFLSIWVFIERLERTGRGGEWAANFARRSIKTSVSPVLSIE